MTGTGGRWRVWGRRAAAVALLAAGLVTAVLGVPLVAPGLVFRRLRPDIVQSQQYDRLP